MTGGVASQTRTELDELANDLEFARVLETNVICFSPSDDGKLKPGGVERGVTIFKTVLDAIRPRVLIMYGQNTLDEARRVGFPQFKIPDRKAPDSIAPTSIVIAPMGEGFEVKVITIRSLGQPDFNKWKASWPRVRHQVVELVRSMCQ